MDGETWLTAEISIHAPLTGSDFDIFVAAQLLSISIHAPLTGSDRSKTATPASFTNFNPRSPYGERLRYMRDGAMDIFISNHAPLTGSDSKTAQNFT